MTVKTKQDGKAGILYSLLSSTLSEKALRYLSADEIQKLSKITQSGGQRGIRQGNEVLKEFIQTLQNKKTGPLGSDPSPLDEIIREMEGLLREDSPEFDFFHKLRNENQKGLQKLVVGEDPRLTAIVLCFADPDESSRLVESFPDALRERIIKEINSLDLHSERIQEELERFLRFKYPLIEGSSSLLKVRRRNSYKVGEILTKISPSLSDDIVSKLKEASPKIAEDIKEHYYSLGDLYSLEREPLENFLSGIHPIVSAVALKGIEMENKEKILEKISPWLKKKIQLELDSLGPVSLAEIEVAQRGILDKMKCLVESGELILWKESKNV